MNVQGRESNMLKKTISSTMNLSVIFCVIIYSTQYVHCQIDTLLCKPINQINNLEKSKYGRIWGNNMYLHVYTILYDKIKYNLTKGFDSTVHSIEIKDSSYQTQQGVKIGMKLNEVLNLTEQHIIHYSYHLGFLYIPLENNWFAVFTSGSFRKYAQKKMIHKIIINSRPQEDEEGVPTEVLLNEEVFTIVKNCSKDIE